tara:strand:+ start:362 stop:577 length:216 start_codon:yes stop_codon:yes gene_type:complete
MAKKESFLSKIRGNSSDSLNEEQSLRKELLDLRMQLSAGQLNQNHKIKEIRKSIAQLKTIKKEEEIKNRND